MSSKQQQVIQKFMSSLAKTTKSGEKALDEAVKACSNYSGIQDVIDHMISDCKKASSADVFLKDYCGINLDDIATGDTGAITGKDAGGSTVKTKYSVVPESGSFDSTFSADSFMVGTLEVKLNGSDFSSLNESEQNIWRGMKSWWIKSAFNLIKESYGSEYDLTNQSDPWTIFVSFIPEGSSRTETARTTPYAPAKLIMLEINLNYYSGIIEGNVDGQSTNANTYLDRMLAHELTHAAMMVNVDNWNTLPNFFIEGIAELTGGIDDLETPYIQAFSSSSNTSALKNYLDLTDTSSSVPVQSYVAGFMLLRYLAKQAAQGSINIIDNTTKNTVVSGTSNADTITNSAGGVKILAGAGNDSIYSSTEQENTVKSDYGYVTIDGGAGNDTIYNYDPHVSINGGAGNDSIYINGNPRGATIKGGTGNDIITNANNGNGKLFLYSSGDGNDTISGAGSSDTLSITGASGETSTIGSDVIVKVGSGSIRLKNAKSNMPKIVGTNPTPNSTTLTVTNSTKSPVTVGSAIKTINASTRTTAVKITGNSLANTIYGGKGNDTLTGGTGNDVFIYASGSGSDVITDYTSNQDKIKITGAKISKSSVSGSDVILSIGSGSIRVKNGKGKTLSIYNNSNSLTNTVFSGDSTTLTITNATSTPVSLSSAIKTVNANSRTSKLLIIGNNKGNTIIGGSGSNTVIGGTGADYITGGKSADEIYGGKGNDTIIGNAGNDYISANEGNDYISGGTGNDSIWGGAGNDTLYGGAGNDTLWGGNGKDNFVFNSGDGNDVIADFTIGEDLLIIEDEYSQQYKNGNLILKFNSGTLTIKNIAYSAYSSRAFIEESDLITDNNFTTSDLDSIINNETNLIINDDLNTQENINPSFLISNSSLNERSDNVDSKNFRR